MMTLKQLLQNEPIENLVDVANELATGVVPATGYAHEYCRKVNGMIDAGLLCINVTNYRRVYLPTLAKEVHREMTRRYLEYLHNYKEA